MKDPTRISDTPHKCRYCEALTTNFKDLLMHYWQHHRKNVVLYKIRHKAKSETKYHKRRNTATVLVRAPTEEDALRFAGWDKKDCIIEVME